MISKVKYDLEERTFIFAQVVTKYIKLLPKNLTNIEMGEQIISRPMRLFVKKTFDAYKNLPERGKGEPLLVKIES